MRLSLLILVVPLLAAGCAHTVGYRLTSKDCWTGPRIEGVLCVQPFADQTVPIIEREEHVDGGTWRTNYRKHYSATNLSSQVTAMVVKHLAYSGLFAKVVSGTDTNADFFLSGTLSNFEVHGRVNHTAEDVQAASGGFGLIGALMGDAATARMTSEIKTKVTLKGLTLSDKTGLSIWQNSISIDTDTNMYFQFANRYSIFYLSDESLEKAVNEMIYRIGNSVSTNHLTAAAHTSAVSARHSDVSGSASKAEKSKSANPPSRN